MAKIIFKMRYRKPGTRASRGGYAKYIATREGVEKIQEAPLHSYADYIALRPGAERMGQHGLFSDADGPADLKSISRVLDEHTGNVWLGVLSMGREDAARLGYDSLNRWQTLLKSHAVDLAEAMGILLNHFRWCAAFHNEKHHPHAHIIAWSEDPKEGFLSEKGIEKFKSAIARDVFAHDLLEIYQQETALRDELRVEGKKQLENLVENVHWDGYVNPEVEQLLLTLARRLRKTKGKKVYGYLRSDLRNMVNEVVKHMADDPRIRELYDLWYIQKEVTIRVYRSEMPQRIPLHENPEFKSLRNVVVREAVKLGKQLPRANSQKGFPKLLPRVTYWQQLRSACSCKLLKIWKWRSARNPSASHRRWTGSCGWRSRGRRWTWGCGYEKGGSMAIYIHFTEDQKARARQTAIAELLRSQGEALKRSGTEVQWRDGPDKVTIRGNLWYHHYEQTGGDAVDFVKKFYRKSYPEAVAFLLGERGGAALAPPIIRERKPFVLPEKNDNMRRVAAYLLEQRGIDRSVLAAFVSRGLIYESLPYHNAVFVGVDRDGVARHAALRGIGSPDYKGNAPGSVPEYSFHWTGQTEPAPNLRTEVQSMHPNVRPRQSEKLYLFEAPIDLLSYISLHPNGWRQHTYAAACSVSDRVLFQCLKDQPGIREVLLCLDSDGPGQGAAKRIKEKLNKLNIQSEILVPSHKDWNEDLIFRESEVQECLQLQG